MKLFEYQSFRLLQDFGIPLPKHILIQKKEELDKALKNVALTKGVVKAQVLAGGRGKAGGIRIAKSLEEIKEQILSLLNWTMVNEQTGKEGLKNEKVLLCSLEEIQNEYYLAFLNDLEQKKRCLLISKSGGVEIENHQESIEKISFAFDGKFKAFERRKIARAINLENTSPSIKIIEDLAQVFCKIDASLLEINPFIQRKDESFCALDAKIILDDSALFRQKALLERIDAKIEEDSLSYIELDGNIGCVVNGAGLAMASMDLLDYHGGKAANFLDVGGGASAEKIQTGLEILAKNPNVMVIFINIFGGIMDCSLVATAIINAEKILKEKKQALILRLEGTGVEKARQILEKSQLDLLLINDLQLAAKTAVEKTRDFHGNLD